jgi:hypothetical protein
MAERPEDERAHFSDSPRLRFPVSGVRPAALVLNGGKP